jgi:hypothetical protein
MDNKAGHKYGIVKCEAANCEELEKKLLSKTSKL